MTQKSAVRILSAGAVKGGVRLCADASLSAASFPFEIEFATAPQIREVLAKYPLVPDVIVAPMADIEVFAAEGKLLANSRACLGDVDTGVAVRGRETAPNLATQEDFRRALLEADLVVYNRASSGAHLERVLETLGIADDVSDKTVRTVTGAEAIMMLADCRENHAIGFGQTTEIKLHEGLGIQFAGPLPKELAKTTTYCAGVSATSSNPEAALTLLDFFSSEQGRSILVRSGIRPLSHR